MQLKLLVVETLEVVDSKNWFDRDFHRTIHSNHHHHHHHKIVVVVVVKRVIMVLVTMVVEA